MEEDQINIDDEYKKLGYKDNNSNTNIRKINSERKLTSGILKRERSRKVSSFAKKDNQLNNSNSIKWDNLSINEQKDYRKNHPLDKEKLKNSISKYNSSVIDNGDVYVKGLNKVNEINPNDEIISKIFYYLNENKNKKCMKRNNSCLNIGKHKRKLNLKEFYRITEKEKIFDESLGEEQKLTLKNTLFNKINKAVPRKDKNTQ